MQSRNTMVLGRIRAFHQRRTDQEYHRSWWNVGTAIRQHCRSNMAIATNGTGLHSTNELGGGGQCQYDDGGVNTKYDNSDEKNRVAKWVYVK